jgi:hypothetical protein
MAVGLSAPQRAALFPNPAIARQHRTLLFSDAQRRGVTFGAFRTAGVPLVQLQRGEFTVHNLLDLGMCGADFADVIPALGVSRFEGLQNQWQKLVAGTASRAWTATDLTQAQSTMADLQYLGVTLDSLCLTKELIVGLPKIRLAEWVAFGMTLARLSPLGLKRPDFDTLQWTYLDVVHAFDLRAPAMVQLGFTLCHQVTSKHVRT